VRLWRYRFESAERRRDVEETRYDRGDGATGLEEPLIAPHRAQSTSQRGELGNRTTAGNRS
jgi:hypothetical protein